MENVLKFIIGALLIILAIAWFNYLKKTILEERKKEQYSLMGYTVSFIVGALILLMIGIKMIFDAF